MSEALGKLARLHRAWEKLSTRVTKKLGHSRWLDLPIDAYWRNQQVLPSPLSKIMEGLTLVGQVAKEECSEMNNRLSLE